VPHTRLIVVHQGEGDTEAALHPLYESNLREFIADLRALCGTDTHTGDVVPCGIVKTKDIEGNLWPAAGLAAVRAAQALVAGEDGNFLIDVDATPSMADAIHDSAEGTLQVGRLIVNSLPEWYASGDPGE
jgi:hypothetical protein